MPAELVAELEKQATACIAGMQALTALGPLPKASSPEYQEIWARVLEARAAYDAAMAQATALLSPD